MFRGNYEDDFDEISINDSVTKEEYDYEYDYGEWEGEDDIRVTQVGYWVRYLVAGVLQPIACLVIVPTLLLFNKVVINPEHTTWLLITLQALITLSTAVVTKSREITRLFKVWLGHTVLTVTLLTVAYGTMLLIGTNEIAPYFPTTFMQDVITYVGKDLLIKILILTVIKMSIDLMVHGSITLVRYFEGSDKITGKKKKTMDDRIVVGNKTVPIQEEPEVQRLMYEEVDNIHVPYRESWL